MSENLHFDASINSKKLFAELDKINARLGTMNSVAEKSGNQMDKTFKRVATAVGGYFSLQMFGRAASGIYNFQKEYESALTEVGTISDEIFGKFPQYQQQVLDLSTKGSQGPKELANSLYQIVSAGYDGAEGLSVLEVAAKAATAGFSETKTTADGITTVLNAWGKPFTEASNVADTFFKTVERGKTTIPELTANIAQIAPIASSLKIPFEEVMGLMAAITKQGTPTAQAATQIRSAIVGIAQEYGDAAFNGRSLIDTFNFVAEEANHSIDAISKSVGRIEGANAILATTGDKLKFAYDEMAIVAGESFGATEKALKRVEETTADITAKLRNNIMASLQPLGEGITKEVSKIAKGLNEAFADGSINEFFEDFAKAAKVGAALLVVFNGSLIAGKLELGAYAAGIKLLTVQEAVLNRWQKLVTAGQLAHSAANVGGTATVTGLNAAMRGLWATMVANPFTAIIAVAGLATAAFLAFRKEVKSAAAVQEDFNQLHSNLEKYKTSLSPMIQRYEELKNIQNKTNEEQAEFNKLVEELAKQIPSATGEINEYGKVISLTSDKLSEFNNSKKDALKAIAEEGLKDAIKSLEVWESKMKTAQEGVKDFEKLQGSYGGYQLDIDVKRTGEEKSISGTKLLEAEAQIEHFRELVNDYKRDLSEINNLAFYQEHAKLFKDLSSVTEEEMYNIKDSLSDLYDIAPDDFAKEKILAQIDKVWDEINKRMEGETKLKPSTKVIFDREAYLKSLKEAKAAFDEYNSLQDDQTKVRYQKENKYVGDGILTYEQYLQQKYDLTKSYNEKVLLEAESTANEYELNWQQGRENLKPLQGKKADVSKIEIGGGTSLYMVDNQLKTLSDKLYKERDASRRADLRKEIEYWNDVKKEMEGYVDDSSKAYSELFENKKYSRLKDFNELQKEIATVIEKEQERLYTLEQSRATEDQIAAQKELLIKLQQRLNEVEEDGLQKIQSYVNTLKSSINGINSSLQEILTEDNFGDQAGPLSEASDSLTEYFNLQMDGASALIQAATTGDIGGVFEAQMNIWLFQAKDAFNRYADIGKGALGFEKNIAMIDKMIEQSERRMELAERKGGMADAYKEEIKLLKQKRKTIEEAIKAEENRTGSFLGFKWDATRSNVVKDLKSDLEDLDSQIMESDQNFDDWLTNGITENTIADGITQALQNSEDPVKAFGDFLDNTLREAIYSSISQKILGEQLSKSMDILSAGFEDGMLSEEEMEAFKAAAGKAYQDGSAMMDAYKEALPELFAPMEEAKKSGMSGSIQNIKEETANILSGQVNSIIMDMKRGIDLQIEMAASLRSIDRNTEYNRHLEKLESIETNIEKIANSSSSERAYGNFG